MKVHTQSFKENIKEMGRELDSKITYVLNDELIELRNSDLNSITPVVQSSLLKSVMKELDIDSNVDIPLGTVINYKFGVSLNGSDYEYLNFGNYIVYSSERQEDTNSYSIICYDRMLTSMVGYETLKTDIKTFPMTVRDYIDCICADLGLFFKNKDEEFANYDKIIETDLYAELGYTYRDILDELAQVTASNIVINSDGEVEIKYINDTNDTINEEYLKDVNVNFGEKYGPINSIVLSRAAESDNVYLQDEESVEANGLCEIKIKENQIMNFNNRDEFLPDILEKLDGLEFYTNDFSSTGICYYNVCDRYNIQIGNEVYSCIMFNDQINITQGLEEIIYTDLPEQAETDYKKADKTDRRINQAYAIVDKQNLTITQMVQQVNEQEERLVQMQTDINGVSISVTNVQNTLDNQQQDIDNLQNELSDTNKSLTETQNNLNNTNSTIEQMTYTFTTKELSINSINDEVSSAIDNHGIRVYNYTILKSVINDKGAGFDDLIVTNTAQIGYLKFIKSKDENYNLVTDIHHLISNVQSVEDLVGDE